MKTEKCVWIVIAVVLTAELISAFAQIRCVLSNDGGDAEEIVCCEGCVGECKTTVYVCPAETNNVKKEMTNSLFSCAWSIEGDEEIIIKESDELSAVVGLQDGTEAGRYEGDVIYEYFWDGELEGGCTQSVAFTVVDVDVEVDDYIGIDMTGDYQSKTNSKTAKATVVPDDFEFSWSEAFDAAEFDPYPPDSCTNARIIEVDVPSGAYTNEAVIVEAGPCAATSRFTVVKIDVEMQGLSEDEEESIGGLVHLNADDDDNNGVLDKDQDGPITNENDLVEFTVEILPDDLPTNDTVTVTGTGIYHDDEKQFPMTSNVFTLAQLAVTNFYVEGTAVSGSPTNYIVQVDHEQSDAVDRALYTVIRADLDIDSDNTSDFGGPYPSDFEEAIEVGSTNPVYAALKYVVVDDYYDADTNGIPGYADGYDNDGIDENADDAIEVGGPKANAVFVPITVRVDEPFPIEGTIIRFDYTGSSTTDIEPTIDSDGVKTWESSGNLRIWTKPQNGSRTGDSVVYGGDFVPEGVEIPLSDFDRDSKIEIGEKKTLYVEGLKRSGSLAEESIAITVINTNLVEGLAMKAEDEIRFTIIKADVDVDTDNDDGFGLPEGAFGPALAEDHYEDIKNSSDYPGKLIAVNDNDDDGDGIPDFADGYNLLEEKYGIVTNIDNVVTNEHFVPIVFEIPEPVDLTKAKVKLTYDASDPLGVSTNSAGEYVMPSGEDQYLRIWTKDGDQERDGHSVTNNGDFLAEGEYDADEFGFTNGIRKLTYYLEGITNSQQVADQQILFEVDPDGDAPGKTHPGYIAADAVRVTLFTLSFYRDADCTEKLIDWAKNGGLLRSPRYTFGEKDNIFVQITGPAGLGNDSIEANVSSDSYPSGVVVKLENMGGGKYRSTGNYPSRIVRVDVTTSFYTDGNKDYVYLELQEEELLSGVIHVNGISLGSPSAVMIDRREYGRCKGYPEDDESLMNERLAEFRIYFNDIGWYQDNRIIGTHVGDVQSGNTDIEAKQCDFLYVLSHGGCGSTASLYSLSFSGVNNPNEIVQLMAPDSSNLPQYEIDPEIHWNEDVEYVWFDACDVFGLAPDEATGEGVDPWIGLHAWDDAMLNEPRQIHALLGYCGPIYHWGDSVIDTFSERLELGDTVKESFINANINHGDNLPSEDSPYVAIINTDNLGDTMAEVTRDSTNSLVNVYWGDVDFLISIDQKEMAAYYAREPLNKPNKTMQIGKIPDVVKVMKVENKLRRRKKFKRQSEFTNETTSKVLSSKHEQTELRLVHMKSTSPDFGSKGCSLYKRIMEEDIPSTAKLSYVFSQYECINIDTDKPNIEDVEVVGRILNYRHFIDGIPLEGDSIRITETGNDDINIQIRWHNNIRDERTVDRSHVLSKENAIRSYFQSRDKIADSVNIRACRFVYRANKDGNIIPYWKIITQDSEVDYVRAIREQADD